MEYMRGWRAFFRDPEWKRKLGVGSLLLASAMVIPVVGQLALIGWSTLATRRAVQGQDSPLPDLRFDFDYLGKLVGVGFKVFLARLLWTMPIVALVMIFAFCMGVGGALVPQGGQTGGAIFGIVTLVGMLFYFVGLFAVSLLSNVAALRAELMGEVGPAVRVKDVMRMTRMLLKELIVGHFVLMLVGLPLIFAGMLTCYVGIFPAAMILTVIATYYNAELYKAYLAKGGEPLPIAELDVAPPSGLAPAVA